MQIVDYASLRSAVLDFLNRSDSGVSARVPDFIALAEGWMMRKLRLRLLETDAALTGTPGSRTIALPTDYREPLNLWWNNGVDRQSLRFVPAGLLDVFTAASLPYFWTVDGTNVAFERPCDQAYSFTFRYRQKLALSNNAPTNVLLTQYPDIYLAATLAEAAPYLRDADALQMWEAKRGSIAHDIREEEERQKSLTTLSTEIGANIMRHRGCGSFNIFRGY